MRDRGRRETKRERGYGEGEARGRERGNYSGDIDPAATRQPLSLDSFGSTPTHLPTRLHSVYLFTFPSLSPSLFVTPAISSSTSYFSSFAASSFPPLGSPIFVLLVMCCAWCGSSEFTSRSPNPRASTQERGGEIERCILGEGLLHGGGPRRWSLRGLNESVPPPPPPPWLSMRSLLPELSFLRV